MSRLAVRLFNARKHGGIWFCSVGRVGFTFYIKRGDAMRK